LKVSRFISKAVWLTLLTVVYSCVPLKIPVKQGETSVSKTNSTVSSRFNDQKTGLPPKGYSLESLAKNLYFFSTGGKDTLFAITSEGTLLVDPFKGGGELLQKALAEVSAPPVKMLIYSQASLKRMAEATLFSENVRVVAHRDTADFIRELGESNIPRPSISFGKNYSLTFGGLQVDLIYPEKGQGRGNSIIYFPAQKVLMLTGAAIPKTIPIQNLNASDIIRRASELKKALKFDFKKYVSGGFYRPGSRQEMNQILSYYFASKAANKKAMESESLKVVKGKTGATNIKKVSGVPGVVTEECYKLLKSRWKKELKGFEKSAKSHCRAWTKFHLKRK
jgi:hypothetical protein